MNPSRRRAAAVVLAVLLIAPACASAATRARGSEDVLRLGIFPNLTHAPGFVALGEGILERGLGATRVEVRVFPSGSEAGTAMLSGALDATYIGPGPAVELFARSDAVAIVSGAVGGGAALVVRDGSGIREPDDLRGRRVAVPAAANTQDVALRTWLHRNGLAARDEGGEVPVLAVQPAELLALFREEQLDAAWVPSPWPELLVAEGVGTVLVDEADLWPGGRFATTNLLVSTAYMDAHPEVVERLVRANVEALRLIQDDPARAIAVTRAQIEARGGPALSAQVTAAAWDDLSFTWDPLSASLVETARRAAALGYLRLDGSDPARDILRIYRLQPLNRILEELSLPTVEIAG